ncbi:hypothetical protein [Corynebacterium parakroppenstedtii]|nr:hypothetical protein [Corynebacterium parakroppenstedtii]
MSPPHKEGKWRKEACGAGVSSRRLLGDLTASLILMVLNPYGEE